jgi:hypothetical protein
MGCERKFVQDDIRQLGRPGFKGFIDEDYIFNRALLPEDVLRLMKRRAKKGGETAQMGGYTFRERFSSNLFHFK